MTNQIKKVLELPMYKCDLREQERNVLWLMLDGYSRDQIANLLNISEATVKKHSANIYAKLGIEGKTQLAKWVIEQIASSIHQPLPLTFEETFNNPVFQEKR
jgi:DNA-binding CsgD family transcriptional regulator